MPSSWKRPESVPFPSTWSTFEGKQIINGGSKRQYWIQDLSDEYHDEAVDIMCKYFVEDEPLCKYSKVNQDPVSLAEFRHLWSQVLHQKLALICLTKNEKGETEIAALNMTAVAQKGDPKIVGKGVTFQKVIGVLDYLSDQKDVYSIIGTNAYLTAMGLFVLPKFRGEGLGLELLKARKPLCEAVGLKATITCFTSIISQKLALRAGFIDMVSVPYDDIEKANPLLSFPGITDFTKVCRNLYIKYD